MRRLAHNPAAASFFTGHANHTDAHLVFVPARSFGGDGANLSKIAAVHVTPFT
jgi:hypothetical protein